MTHERHDRPRRPTATETRISGRRGERKNVRQLNSNRQPQILSTVIRAPEVPDERGERETGEGERANIYDNYNGFLRRRSSATLRAAEPLQGILAILGVPSFFDLGGN